jgi:hypothetical protein
MKPSRGEKALGGAQLFSGGPNHYWQYHNFYYYYYYYYYNYNYYYYCYYFYYCVRGHPCS